MTLLRFVLVLLLVTVLAGVVGGGAGALFGLGMPRQVQVQGEAQGSGRSDAGEQRDGSSSGKVGMQVQADRSPILTGAAWGAGFGLLIGGPCGLLVALADQGALLIRQRKETT